MFSTKEIQAGKKNSSCHAAELFIVEILKRLVLLTYYTKSGPAVFSTKQDKFPLKRQKGQPDINPLLFI
jgi:hypothetical protein